MLAIWLCASGLSLAQQKPQGAGTDTDAGSVTIRLKLVPSAPAPSSAIVDSKTPEGNVAGSTSSLEIESAADIELKLAGERFKREAMNATVASQASDKPSLRKPGIPKLAELTNFEAVEAGASADQQRELAPDPLSLPTTGGVGSTLGSDRRFPRSPYHSKIAPKNAGKKPSQTLELNASDDSSAKDELVLEPVESPELAGAPERILEASDRAIALSGSHDEDSIHDHADEQSSHGTPTECPGSPGKSELAMEVQPDDLPLEQDEHPYDAPAARSTPSTKQSREISDYSPANTELRREINECLNYYLTHPENVTKRGPWALMHAALPFGVESEVIAGNRKVNALGWMCYNGVCAKQRIFQPTKQGFRTNVGPGVQGHEGQFLAILAQSKVQSDYPIVIGNRRYAIADLVKYEMATCREKSELTFKLIGLSHYLDPNQQWRDNRGQTWNLEKMVAEELAQPVIGAACGGSHRLMGLSFSVIKRQQAGLPLDGHWKRAELFLNDYVNYAMSLQNPNGSFSTEWFEGRGNEPNVERQVQTTGHILEWLIFTLPDEHLQSPRIQKSVQFLLDTIGKDPSRNWPIGPRGHALRALAMYNQRVFGAEVGNTRGYVAEVLGSTAKR